MEKAKYHPEEIDRMIDEEISRIDACNSMVAAQDIQRNKKASRSPLSRMLDYLRTRCSVRKRRTPADPPET